MKVLASLAVQGKINQDANIRDSQSTIINAPVEKVWKALVEIEKWPEWNHDIRSAQIKQFAVGEKFEWDMNGRTIKSTLRQIKPNEMLSWTGRTFGIKAIQVWTLEKSDGGQTIVSAEESLEGPLTLFYGHQSLHSNLLNWLSRLSQYATKI